ncbi:MAG: N-acetylglucosamine-6-phosphate deacetylase [Rhodocyclaceae bacterium]|jgi:N-acetylglucosamine-6-phosphate deacetylase|nr:N-acetylglucosamine-6-phosphate deacetylase [Rhodocyclaceae bacterium]MCE2724132.1 N-acetylglucosamine-6-phosphate deacetylase [Betaproteobacteria bacterium]MCA3020433.1 N-acetylglucosamine-6-phosphate deacetylase [Rhodocyclaceae bacterium]MCA3021937.1 N-acetylglucosamine-6-phosphate deacetylase [Rhodocyclaceae bacterium]MCA3025780.1 N-acetylglucosamine-6-phosphate deacetylase [Rhodocyclaceae bacterium]
MSAATIKGNILTAEGFIAGQLQTDVNGRVASIHGEPIDSAAVRDSATPILLPGFIDTHVHGGGGRDTMEGGNSVEVIAETHAKYGTTALLATTMTAPAEDLENAFAVLGDICRRDNMCTGRGARVLGVHLEGPYINAAMLGAQPDFARPLALAEVIRLHRLAPIRLITLAPEVPGNMQLIGSLVAAGFTVQLGHTAGSFEEGIEAMSYGAKGFTHLFNAMTGMHHRKPGMAGAALANAEYAEIIPDFLHVHAGAMRVALRAIPKLFCVTDSTAASGMPDGEYRLGRHTVTKCLGGVRLADGTLAGSTLTMDQAFRNLVNTLGLDLIDASQRVSTNAADYLGITDRGRLRVGGWADVVILDRELEIQGVMVEGNLLN